MRRALIIALPVVLAGCAPTYALVPRGDGVVGKDGLRLVGAGDAWNNNPYDLPNYMTPILVDIENHTGKDVRISYGDFSLTDERGFRYAAINPYTTAAQVGMNESATRLDDGARVTLAAYTGRSDAHRARPAPRRREHRRFFVRPRARVFFHYYDPWVYPFYDAPYYGDRVVVWTDRSPSPPSEDVLRLGLPEGVVKPGGRISGFLYFQNAGQHGQHLRLSWAAHTPAGKPVATLSVPFNVVRR